MKILDYFKVLALTLLCSFAHAVQVDFVTVGNAGNTPDIRYETPGYGSVSYKYHIGKYEVTAGQYTEFLNAVAKDDPNSLYNTWMGSIGDAGANIIRSGSPSAYIYSVAADWANRPVNYVSFWDAARFANWLHNGQPTGPQGPGTTEDGAYLNVGNQSTFARQSGAKFVVPTEDEWYKAAYHNQGAGLAASYFDYPTGTNTAPGKDLTEATNPGNNANHFNNGYTIGSPYYRTKVGEFELSDSPYGTFDQGGNVHEWNETALLGSNRGLRGGSFYFPPINRMHASFRSSDAPTSEYYTLGFRVVSLIPEPGCITLCVAGIMMLMLRRAVCESWGKS